MSCKTLRAVATLVAIAFFVLPTASPVDAQTREARVAAISSLTVHARPIEAFDPADKSKTRFGDLEFRSGLILTSPFKGFGGLSAIRLSADGKSFAALSDQGDLWL